jgi:hypothetical protein
MTNLLDQRQGSGHSPALHFDQARNIAQAEQNWSKNHGSMMFLVFINSVFQQNRSSILIKRVRSFVGLRGNLR